MSQSAPEFKFLGTYVIETEPVDYQWAGFQPSGGISDILQSSDGGFLLSGFGRRDAFSANLHTRLVKLSSQGLLERSFGDQGVLRFGYPDSAMESIQVSREDSFGRFVTLGQMYLASKEQVTLDTPSPGEALALSRVLPSGQLDSTFGQGGQVVFGLSQVAANSFIPIDLKLLADGGMLLLTTAATLQGNTPVGYHAMLVQLREDGSLNTTFNGNGVLHLPKEFGLAKSLTMTADGGFLVDLAQAQGQKYLGPAKVVHTQVKVDASGLVLGEPQSVDVLAVLNGGQHAIRAYDINAFGQVLVVGDTTRNWFAVRMNADGSKDTSFNGGEALILPIPDGTDEILADGVTRLADGSYLITGKIWRPDPLGRWPEPYSPFLLKLTSSGMIDTQFGHGGMVEADIGLHISTIETLGDGSIAWAGSADIELLRDGEASRQGSFAFSRLTADGRPDLNFGQELGLMPRTMVWEGESRYVQLSPFASVVDPDLQPLENPSTAGAYDGYQLVIMRKSGASAADDFTGLSGHQWGLGKDGLLTQINVGLVLTEDGQALLDNVHIGNVLSKTGSLSILFNENATQHTVNQLLSHIGYRYQSPSPPVDAPVVKATHPGVLSGQLYDYKLIELIWRLQEPQSPDGNNAPLIGEATTGLLLVTQDDPTTGTIQIEGTAEVGQTLRVVPQLEDPDGAVELLNYQWRANGEWIWGQGNGTDKLTLSPNETGKTITVNVQSRDSAGGWGNFSATMSEVIRVSQTPQVKFWADTTKVPKDIGLSDAITLTDVLETLKLYLGKPVGNPSPYKYLAADIDGNGLLSLSDVLTTLKVYLGKSTPVQPSWVYAPRAEVESNDSHFNASTIPVKVLASLNEAASGVELVGVLRGDVNGSWTGALA